MRTVHQHLGFHDGHQPCFLAERRIASQRLGVRFQACGAGQTLLRLNADHRPPLGETRPQFAVLPQPLPQAVQTLGDRLMRVAGQWPGTQVHLDAGQDAAFPQQLREKPPGGALLAQGFIKKDHAADIALHAGRPDQQLPVIAPVLLTGLQADGGETLRDGRKTLIDGENTLACINQGVCRFL